jgi:hypothetical protein
MGVLGALVDLGGKDVLFKRGVSGGASNKPIDYLVFIWRGLTDAVYGVSYGRFAAATL